MEFKERFRGYLPVVMDLETGGFDRRVHALLELGCYFLNWEDDQLTVGEGHLWEVTPFEGAEIDPASAKVTGIDVNAPDRNSHDEKFVLAECFKLVRARMKAAGCHRAILVAHNAAFDQGFLGAACERQQIKRNPFHPFSTLDTAALAAVAYGHTVLSEACRRAGMEFDNSSAHSAAYDAERTAQLFCRMVNMWPPTSVMSPAVKTD